jgi:hypothetical protein
MTGQVVDLDEDGYLDVVQHGRRKENKLTLFYRCRLLAQPG